MWYRSRIGSGPLTSAWSEEFGRAQSAALGWFVLGTERRWQTAQVLSVRDQGYQGFRIRDFNPHTKVSRLVFPAPLGPSNRKLGSSFATDFRYK